MRILKMIFAVLFFIIAFIFIVTGIVSFTIPDMGKSWGIGFLITGGLFVWFGALLCKKQKNKNDVNTEQKPTEPTKNNNMPLTETAIPPTQDTISNKYEPPQNKKPELFTEILINYKDSKGDISARKISNCSALTRDGVKYITAYCHLRGKVRSFLFDRIEKLFINGTEADMYEFYDILENS